MKKITIVLIAIIIIGFGGYYIYNSKTYSFNDVASLNKENVTSVEIKYNDEKVLLKNPEDIKKFINKLSNIKLKKKNGSADKSGITYWVRIFENNKEIYGLTFNNDTDLDIYKFSERKFYHYKIKDYNNLDIEKYN